MTFTPGAFGNIPYAKQENLHTLGSWLSLPEKNDFNPNDSIEKLIEKNQILLSKSKQKGVTFELPLFKEDV